jgi:hypothetical protein
MNTAPGAQPYEALTFGSLDVYGTDSLLPASHYKLIHRVLSLKSIFIDVYGLASHCFFLYGFICLTHYHHQQELMSLQLSML